MTTVHPNETLLRRVFDEFADPTMIAEVFAEDAEWVEPGDSPISGRYRGRDAVAGLFATVVERSDGTFRVVGVNDVLANDRHGCVMALVEAQRGGRPIRTEDTIVFDLRDGRIARGRVLSEDQLEVDTFWA
jgi:ketosteroid isomerase-like protein